MNIKMISPRSIFNRNPAGRDVLENKYSFASKSPNTTNISKNDSDKFKDEFWIVKKIGNQQFELYANDCKAVLHNFSSIDNTLVFTGYTESPIKCITFACLSKNVTTNATTESVFESLESSIPKGVMLFTESVAKYYGFDAEMHSCKLPCQISSAWSLRNCIFVERKDQFLKYETIAKTTDIYSPISLFLMTHTLSEFTPVIFKDENGHTGFVNDSSFKIVALCPITFLLLAYNRLDEMFSLWHVRDVVREDFAHLYQKHWDGSMSIKMDKLHCNCSCSLSQQVVANDREPCPDSSSHVSAEYFEISVMKTASQQHQPPLLHPGQNRTIADLDLRSPLARSFKSVVDSEILNKMPMTNGLHESQRKLALPFQRQMGEPLYPKVCLDHLFHFGSSHRHKFTGSVTLSHSTPVPAYSGNYRCHYHHDNQSAKKLVTSTHGFFAEDFYQRKYLCCLIRHQSSDRLGTLQIVRYNYDNCDGTAPAFRFVDQQSLQVKDAVYLDKLKLIIILETSTALSIYSGSAFVCHISLFNASVYEIDFFLEEVGHELSGEDIGSVFRLSEPTDIGFTFHTETGKRFRLYLPELVRFHLVKKCLFLLKKLLPINVGVTFLCRWYALNNAVDNNEPDSAEWPRFIEFLLDNLGFTKKSIISNDHQSSIVEDVEHMCLDNADVVVNNNNNDNTNISGYDHGYCDRNKTGAVLIDNSENEAGTEDSICNENDVNGNDGSCTTKKMRTEISVNDLGTVFALVNRQSINMDRLSQYSGLNTNVGDRLLSPYAPMVLLSLHLVYETEKMRYFSSSSYLDTLTALSCSLAYSLQAGKYIDYYVEDNHRLWSRVNRLPSLLPFVDRTFCQTIWTEEPPNFVKWLKNVQSGIHPDQPRYPIIADLNNVHWNLAKTWLVMFRSVELKRDPVELLNRYLVRISFDPETEKPTTFPLSVSHDLGQASIDGNVLDIKNVFERVAMFLGQTDSPFQFRDIDQMSPGLGTIFKLIFYHCNRFPHLYTVLHRPDLEKQRQLIWPIISESQVPDVITNPLKTFRLLSQARQNCYSYWTSHVKPFRKVSFQNGASTSRRNPFFAGAGTGIRPRLMTSDYEFGAKSVDNHYLLAILDCEPSVQLAFPDVRIHEAYKMLQSCCPIELDVTICNNYTSDDGENVSNALKEELEGHLKIINCQRTFALPIGRGMIGLHIVQSNWLGDKLIVPQLCLSGKFSLSDSGKPQMIETNASTKQWPNFHNGVATGLMMAPLNETVDFVWILNQCSTTNIDKIELTPEQAGILLGLGLNGHLNKLSLDTIGQIIKSMNEMATMAILIGLSAFNLGSQNSALFKHISFHYRRLIPGEKDQNDPIPTLFQVSAIIAAGLLNFKSCDRKMVRIFIEEMGRSREQLCADGSPPLDIELTCATAGFTVGLIMFQQGNVFCHEHNAEELVRLVSYLKGTSRVQTKESVCNEIPSDSHIRAILKNHDLKKPQSISDVDNLSTFQTKNPRVHEGECYNTDITGCGAAVALGMIFMDSSNETIADHLKCPESFDMLEKIRSPVLCFRQIAHGLIMWREIRPTEEWLSNSIPGFVSSKAFIHKTAGIHDKYLETANESYLQMLIGSCFAMALRYAGTDNPDACQTIMHYIEKLLNIKADADLMLHISRNQFDWALSNLFLCACMVAAGSGNLQLLRMSRYLRSIHYPKDCANYGVHMAYAMSIGLLFLGGGKLTLSNSPRCAAILLIAFFPRFPPSYNGRRYHLQALRHLYVIATRPRIICAVDLDSQTAVPVNSRIMFKNGMVREYQRCFVYPPENPALIKQIEFGYEENRYWPQVYKPNCDSWRILLESLQSGGYFFMKQKPEKDEIEEFVDRFTIDHTTLGHQIKDYRLFSNFVLNTHSNLTIQDFPFNLFKIDTRCAKFTFSNKSVLVQLCVKLLSMGTFDFQKFVEFIDWCHTINNTGDDDINSSMLRIGGTFTSICNLSFHKIHEMVSLVVSDEGFNPSKIENMIFNAICQ